MGCLLAEPIVDGLEEDMQGSLVVLRIEVQEPAGSELADQFDVRGTPTFVLLDGSGEEIWRQVGTLDPARVQELVREIPETP